MSVDVAFEGKPHDLGGNFNVCRVLPNLARRMVGPFVFFDQMGPVQMAPDHGLDVRPHIGLATVTYLFDGEVLHRDSLGSEQLIRSGELNWMTAGRGITHSERSSPAARRAGARLHGLQLWAALPDSHEETEPSFHHYNEESLPQVERPGVRLRVIAGSACGVESPSRVYSPLFFVEAHVDKGATLSLPEEHAQRAAYVVSGIVEAEGDSGNESHGSSTMLAFNREGAATLVAREPAHVMLLGGAPVGERHLFWNFVSSSKTRLKKAKADWQNDRFAHVPGDHERIPLAD